MARYRQHGIAGSHRLVSDPEGFTRLFHHSQRRLHPGSGSFIGKSRLLRISMVYGRERNHVIKRQFRIGFVHQLRHFRR